MTDGSSPAEEDSAITTTTSTLPTTRDAITSTLESVVQNNRFTIAVIFPTIGAITLVASAEGVLPTFLEFNPLLILLGVAVMRLPIITGLLPVLDRRALALLGVLLGYTYTIEYIGATTGIPYGEFAYGVSLGPMLLGTIPFALGLFFVPLVLNSYVLCLLTLGDRATLRRYRLPLTIAIIVLVDLILDPAAVALGFWSFVEGGYYGVPPSNYAGWVLSATVATLLVDAAFDRLALRKRIETCEFVLDDLVSFVLLWSVIAFIYGAWIPVALAIGIGLWLARLGRFDVIELQLSSR